MDESRRLFERSAGSCYVALASFSTTAARVGGKPNNLVEARLRNAARRDAVHSVQPFFDNRGGQVHDRASLDKREHEK